MKERPEGLEECVLNASIPFGLPLLGNSNQEYNTVEALGLYCALDIFDTYLKV